MMRYYHSKAQRQAAIAAGEASARQSTVYDGCKHYAVVRYHDDGAREIVRNLTNTAQDNLVEAQRVAHRLDHGPFARGVAGYAAERIA